jgi:hypothetical protein
VIERVGLVGIPQYTTVECGPITVGCEMPQHNVLHLAIGERQSTAR